MFKKISMGVLLLGLSAMTLADDTHHAWTYHGDGAPEKWGSLSAEYATCSGQNQTPIDITGGFDADLPNLKINYKNTKANTILNNGHTIQVNYIDGGTITVDNQSFSLKQMHFHTPSENHINGQSFPMELHLVHANDEGELAVIGVMIQTGKPHSELSKLWQHMPQKAGESVKLLDIYQVSPQTFLPSNQDYYRFSGSLTTPPCSEGVRWLVMKNTIEASDVQIKNFSDTMGTHTNRPLQKLNGRVILY